MYLIRDVLDDKGMYLMIRGVLDEEGGVPNSHYSFTLASQGVKMATTNVT